MKKNVKLNYIYNLGYQIFTMLIPLITTPYISRVLLADGIGKYTYTYSITNYFVIFAQLGFGYYAQREIAKYQNNRNQQSIIFFEVMIVKIIAVIISAGTFTIMCSVGIFGDYTNLMWWWVILILAQGVDIAFLYQGNEEFGKVVGRNLIIKIIGIISIFAFVKTASHVWVYIVSIALSNFLGALSTWIYLPKYINRVPIRTLRPLRHIRPTLQLFIPTVASVLYAYIDRTLIGLLVQGTFSQTTVMIGDGISNSVETVKKIADTENGYYEQAEKIVKVGTSVLTALGSVMLPRNASEFASGNKEKLIDNIKNAFRFCFFIGLPLMFGLLAISDNLIPWFLGNDFNKCILYLRLFSPLVLLIGIDNILGIQFLITTGQDRKYTVAVVVGLLINIVLNIVLIPRYWGTGAIVASLIAELTIISVMGFFVHDSIPFKKVILSSKNYVLSSLIMFVVVFETQAFLPATMLNTLLLIFEGIITYVVILLIMKDQFVLNIIKQFMSKIKKR